jgi:hypothetical protein
MGGVGVLHFGVKMTIIGSDDHYLGCFPQY